MSKARRVSYKILYDGAEIGLSSDMDKNALESLSYTDNDQGKSDEISLVFYDNQAEWLKNTMVLEKGHDLDVTLNFHDWDKEGDYKTYHCGNFTVDDITFSGRPLTCTIKAVSVPSNVEFQTVLRYQTWENVSIKQIAQEKLAYYDMRDLYFNADEVIIAKVEQSEETDSAFLQRLCNDNGLFIKIYKLDFVIFDKKGYEGRGVKYSFAETDLESWSWNSTLIGTYTGAHIRYSDPNQGTKDRSENGTRYIDVTVGTDERLLIMNEHAKDEEEARRKAIAKVNSENEKAVTVNFSIFSFINLYATENFYLASMGRVTGKYYTESVTHTFGSSGHKSTVKGYRIFERL